MSPPQTAPQAERGHRLGQFVFTKSHPVPPTHRAHGVAAKAGEFQLLFESDQMIRDWLNAWSLWIVVELDNGWKAWGIFDLLHSTRHTQDLIDMCGL